MEHDRVAEALTIAVTAGLRLDLLDLCVHRFAKSIGRFQHDRVDDSVEVSLHHRCRANHRFEFAVLRPADPFVPRTTRPQRQSRITRHEVQRSNEGAQWACRWLRDHDLH